MHRRSSMNPSRFTPRTLPPLLALALGLAGCAAITHDVHQYYSQMAANFKEAEEKAGVQIATRESEANLMLKGGDVHKFQRAQREVKRLKDWQAHCARQRERFEQAAHKLEPAPAEGQNHPVEPAS